VAYRIQKAVCSAYPLADNVKARVLRPDGTYERIKPPQGAPGMRSQDQFIALARRAAFSDASRPASFEPLLSNAARPPQKRRRLAPRAHEP
jgi:hypothetical protein